MAPKKARQPKGVAKSTSKPKSTAVPKGASVAPAIVDGEASAKRRISVKTRDAQHGDSNAAEESLTDRVFNSPPSKRALSEELSEQMAADAKGVIVDAASQQPPMTPEPKVPAVSPVHAQMSSPKPKMSPKPKTGASPTPRFVASPKAKKLAKSGRTSTDSTTSRGGVLNKDEQQVFQAWLKRQKAQGSAKAIEWNVNHGDETWRRQFHADWKVMRDESKSKAQQTTGNVKEASIGGSDDWYTLYEFAELEKMDVKASLTIELFNKLKKRPNRNTEFADIKEMEEGQYSKAAKMKWSEKHSRETKCVSNTELSIIDAEAMEKQLLDEAERQVIMPGTSSSSVPRIKVVKIITLESSMKKMKSLHKLLGSEKVMSEGYLVKLKSTMKPWSKDLALDLEHALCELTDACAYLFVASSGQHTLEDAIEINKTYDTFLNTYKKGIQAKVVVMLAGCS